MASNALHGMGGDGTVTLYDKNQGSQHAQQQLTQAFGYTKETLKVINPFVGGAFGSGLGAAYQAYLAMLAAIMLERSVRVTRLTIAVAAGRIINPKTARSQILGGAVMGIGMALQEESMFDHRLGRIMNHNLAEYHVPCHADVYDIDVMFVDEPDSEISPIGVKGVGEIGIVGTAAAIANAIYHATGKRVRDLPITLDKLL